MSTRIGLIADVHAELDSLRLAIDILKGQGVAQIVCAGDLLEKGREGDEVVARIQAEGILCVQGNHDHDASANQVWLRKNADHQVLKARGYWLADETLAFASTLPQTRRFEWEGVRVLVAHGAPWSSIQYVFANSHQRLFERIAKEAGEDTNIIVLGHTHTPMHVQHGKLMIINPGAVCGRQSFGSHTCGILTLPEREFKVLSLRSGQPAVIDDGLMLDW